MKNDKDISQIDKNTCIRVDQNFKFEVELKQYDGKRLQFSARGISFNEQPASPSVNVQLSHATAYAGKECHQD